MNYDTEYEVRDRGESFVGTVSFGALRLALLFGSAAVAFAVILTPILNGTSRKMQESAGINQVDPVVTGSTKRNPAAYRVSRSVLHDNLHEPCVIYADGRTRGNC